MTQDHTACGHERELHTPETRMKIIKRMMEILEPHFYDYDGFIVSGYSMTIIGSILAHLTGKKLAIVRKKDETRNSSHHVEGVHGCRYVFVDDLIASGTTFNRVKDGIRELDSELVALMLWRVWWTETRPGVQTWMSEHLPDQWLAEAAAKESE